MKKMTAALCGAVAGALVLAVCAGCASKTDTTVPTVTPEEAYAELSQYGNTNGGYNNVRTEEAVFSNDVVTITVKDGKKHVVSLAEAKKIFSVTVDGVTYSLPCAVSKVEAAGWEYSPSNKFRTSKLDEFRGFEPKFGENYIVFKQGATDEYGTADNEILVDVANATHAERTYWRDCTVLGMAFYASESDMSTDLEGMADFKTGIGINVGDPIQKVIDLFGCWKYYDDSLDKESDLFAIYTNVGGKEVAIGYVNFYQTDGIITFVHVKVNVNYVDVLK